MFRTPPCASLVLPLILALCLPVDAATPPAAPAAPPASATTPTPLMAAISAAMADGQATLAGLTARLAATTDDGAAFALQKEIEQAKRDTEARILGVQAEFARREGRLDQAMDLEAMMTQLRGPRAAATIDPAPAAPATPQR